MYRPTHLLIMRPRGMSEAAILAPVVCALRQAHPALRITIFTQHNFRPFFADINDIEFIDYIPAEHKGFFRLRPLAGEILQLGIDAVADLEDSRITRALCRALASRGAAVSVAERDKDAMHRLTRRVNKHIEPLVPEVEVYRKAIATLGLDLELPSHYIGEKRAHELPSKVVTAAGIKHGIWVGIAPFTRHKGKIYPIPLSDKLIEILCSRYERIFILGSGEHERSFAEGMEKRHKGVLSMVGKLDMSLEMDIISNLDVVVTMDSAVLHIASLAGIPAVSVWGSTHPYAGFYGFGQNPANVVQLDMPCRPCSIGGDRKCIFAHYHCLTGIPPERIAEAVEKIIEN